MDNHYPEQTDEGIPVENSPVENSLPSKPEIDNAIEDLNATGVKLSVENISNSLKSNKEAVKSAVSQLPSMISYASNELKNDTSFLIQCMESLIKKDDPNNVSSLVKVSMFLLYVPPDKLTELLNAQSLDSIFKHRLMKYLEESLQHDNSPEHQESKRVIISILHSLIAPVAEAQSYDIPVAQQVNNKNGAYIQGGKSRKKDLKKIRTTSKRNKVRRTRKNHRKNH